MTETTIAKRKIVHRTSGRSHGPVIRLVSPVDLGNAIKPFIFLDLFDLESSRTDGFGYHPHSGIVTVTTMFKGNSHYEDSVGKAGFLRAGGIEWMRAGNGVWHTGAPVKGERVYGYQLWLALPPELENAAAESRYIEPENVPENGPVRVILGKYGHMVSPLPELSPLTYLHVRLEDGETWAYDPPEGHDVLWLAVESGVLSVSDDSISNEIAVFEPGSETIICKAKGKVNFVLGSAAQHPCPLVTGYYSVHTNSEALAMGELGIKSVAQQLKAAGKM